MYFLLSVYLTTANRIHPLLLRRRGTALLYYGNLKLTWARERVCFFFFGDGDVHRLAA